MDINNEIVKSPPADQDAELAILSAILLDSEAIASANEIIRTDDFYRPDYRSVFAAMSGLYSAGRPIDIITLKNKLEEQGLFEQIGGKELLITIAGYSSTSANIRHYCRIVADKAVLRRLISASQAISLKSYDASLSLDAVIDFAEKSIFDISQNRNSQPFADIKELMKTTLTTVEEIYKSGGRLTGLATGFTDLDEITAGLQKSDLILIAGRPSMGKTTLGLNIAQHAATTGIPTAVFSLEMSKEQLAIRMLCTEALIDSHKLRTGDLKDEDWIKIAEAMPVLGTAPLYIDDTPGITVSEVRAKCRKLKLEKGLELVVIDYMQLMSGSSRSDNRQQEISEISRSLKALAREIQAPVIAMSQLSRKNEARSDHRPMLSDLRDSGAIEQDADIVAFIYREDYYKPDTEKQNVAEIILAKHRNGATGTIELLFIKEFTKFVNKAAGSYGY